VGVILQQTISVLKDNRSMKKFSVLFLILVSIAGCSTAPSRQSINNIGVQNGPPVLLFSMAYQSECKIGLNWVDLVNTKNQKVYKHSPLLFREFQKEEEIIINNPYIKSDFKNISANVFAFQLDEGTYSFLLNNSSGYYDKPLVVGGIELKSGDVKYIGEYKWEGCGKLAVTHSNKWTRDQTKIKELYNSLDTSAVNIDLHSVKPAKL
jgi:hypothetical protein